jgi:hypothetical protein
MVSKSDICLGRGILCIKPAEEILVFYKNLLKGLRKQRQKMPFEGLTELLNY